MKKTIQISESFGIIMVLTFAGGFMDACSYLLRGEVFTTAQTGNLLLLGLNLSQGDFQMAIRYCIPLIAYTVGIGLAEYMRSKHNNWFHWRQVSVIIEVIILIVVSFIPSGSNLIANALISLVAGIQTESFQKIHGKGIATTMCTGNLRLASQNMSDYFRTKEHGFLRIGLLYYSTILFFVLGAVFGSQMIKIFNLQAILICALILVFAFLLMFVDREQQV